MGLKILGEKKLRECFIWKPSCEWKLSAAENAATTPHPNDFHTNTFGKWHELPTPLNAPHSTSPHQRLCGVVATVGQITHHIELKNACGTALFRSFPKRYWVPTSSPKSVNLYWLVLHILCNYVLNSVVEGHHFWYAGHQSHLNIQSILFNNY